MDSVDKMLGYDDEYQSTEGTRMLYQRGWGSWFWDAACIMHPAVNWMVAFKTPANFAEQFVVLQSTEIITNAMRRD